MGKDAAFQILEKGLADVGVGGVAAGIPVVITFLLIASSMAPLYQGKLWALGALP